MRLAIGTCIVLALMCAAGCHSTPNAAGPQEGALCCQSAAGATCPLATGAAATGGATCPLATGATCPGAAGPMLAHSVYFTLKENTPAACEKLVEGCKKYLKDGHPGLVCFAVGTLAEELKREVNVRDFQVALQLVFAGMQCMEEYLKSAKHDQFLAEYKDLWTTVRVYDSIIK
jgi:hypothetical protein